jgi:hypothetical protein
VREPDEVLEVDLVVGPVAEDGRRLAERLGAALVALGLGAPGRRGLGVVPARLLEQ